MSDMPQPPDPSWAWAIRTAMYAAFSSGAGALGHILRSMEAGRPVSFTRTVVEALAAGLAGLIAMWICQALSISEEWTAVTVALCGWLGADASIQVLQRLVWRKLGIADPNKDTPT